MIRLGDPENRVQVVGKEVLVDDKHFADGADEDAAKTIAIALNYMGVPAEMWDREAFEHIEKVLA